MNQLEWARENTRTLLLVGGGYVAYVEFGGGAYPEAPEWTPLLVLALLAVAIVGALTSGRLEDLWPEDHGIYLEVVNDYDTEEMPVYELSEDQFAGCEVVNGPLNPLPENKHESYECFHYDPERNVAVGTWRKSKPASAIVGHVTVDGALDEIRELRAFLEAEARLGIKLRQELPGVMRELDAARLESQVRMMESDLAPTFGAEGIDEVLQRTLPEHYLPDRLKTGKVEALMDAEDNETTDESEASDPAGITVSVDAEALSAAGHAENGTEEADDE